MDMQSAVVLLSGGQASTTCLAWATKKFESLHTVSFFYGQRHRCELEFAVELSKKAEALSHKVIDLSDLFAQVTKSRLMEKDSAIADKSQDDPVLPASFVPFRNVFFLTVAAAHAYFLKAGNLVTGICQTDYSGYPDCRNEFAKAINLVLTLAVAKPLEVHTPLMWMTKADTVKLMMVMESADLQCWDWLARTHTCYEGQFPPCGQCSACVLRANGFREAGYGDPLVQRAIYEMKLLPDCDRFSGRYPAGNEEQAEMGV